VEQKFGNRVERVLVAASFAKAAVSAALTGKVLEMNEGFCKHATEAFGVTENFHFSRYLFLFCSKSTSTLLHPL